MVSNDHIKHHRVAGQPAIRFFIQRKGQMTKNQTTEQGMQVAMEYIDLLEQAEFEYICIEEINEQGNLEVWESIERMIADQYSAYGIK